MFDWILNTPSDVHTFLRFFLLIPKVEVNTKYFRNISKPFKSLPNGRLIRNSFRVHTTALVPEIRVLNVTCNYFQHPINIYKFPLMGPSNRILLALLFELVQEDFAERIRLFWQLKCFWFFLFSRCVVVLYDPRTNLQTHIFNPEK